MKTIHKFGFKVNDSVSIPISNLVRILHVAQQQGSQIGELVLWAEVNTEAFYPDNSVRLYVCGTGHDISNIPANAHYWKTVQEINGSGLVWHVYTCEETPGEDN